MTEHETPISDPLCTRPPKGVIDRSAIVQPNKANTIRLMYDPKDTDRARWFDTSAGMPAVRAGNEVAYFVRGAEAFPAMIEAVKLTSEPLPEPDWTHRPCIYLLGWNFSHNLPLISGDPSSRMGELFRQASAHGVEIRAQLWANLKSIGLPSTAMTAPAVGFINALPTGRAIVDQKTNILSRAKLTHNPQPGMENPSIIIRRGSHHQKVLVTNGRNGLIAFCGGIDMFDDRVDNLSRVDEAGNLNPIVALHDVHCRIRGPAAHDLLRLFAARWHDYLEQGDHGDVFHDSVPPTTALGFPDTSKRELRGENTKAPGAVYGDQYVQICRTFIKGQYSFAPRGEQSVRKAVLKAIAAARHFIYMEEQYLFNLEAADALAAAIARPTFRHLIIVIPHDNAIADEQLDQPAYYRAEFLQRLQGAGKEKVHVFTADRYVHSKIYVVDDKFAIIGSANCNRRGWESDSEAVAAIFDESSDEEPTWHFARRLRVRLWADHLNLASHPNLPHPVNTSATMRPYMPTSDDAEFSELADGIAAAVHWLKRAPKARVAPYVNSPPAPTADQALQGALKRKLTGFIASRVQHYLETHPPSARAVRDAVIDPPSSLGAPE